MNKKYELITTQKHIERLHEQCAPRLIKVVLDMTEVYVTQSSKFWDASLFIIEDTLLSRIDKIRVVSLFMMLGAVVEFDGHSYNYVTYSAFWDYLLGHKFITNEEYDVLCGMGTDGPITFVNPI